MSLPLYIDAMKISSVEFVKSATKTGQCPEEGLPEVAFAGRSNVGKSSLINKLVNRKSLAKTSGTPGHTRLLNFFRVNNRYMFCDLPGYGFAKVSGREKEKWREMIEDYLVNRPPLRVAVIIVDIRRKPGQQERDLMAFLTHEGITPLIVATKADKLGKTKRVKPLRTISEELGVPRENLVVFSSRTGEGREDLWRRLRELLEN